MGWDYSSRTKSLVLISFNPVFLSRIQSPCRHVFAGIFDECYNLSIVLLFAPQSLNMEHYSRTGLWAFTSGTSVDHWQNQQEWVLYSRRSVPNQGVVTKQQIRGFTISEVIHRSVNVEIETKPKSVRVCQDQQLQKPSV